MTLRDALRDLGDEPFEKTLPTFVLPLKSSPGWRKMAVAFVYVEENVSKDENINRMGIRVFQKQQNRDSIVVYITLARKRLPKNHHLPKIQRVYHTRV